MFLLYQRQSGGKTYQDSSRRTVKRLLPRYYPYSAGNIGNRPPRTTGYGKFDSATGNAPFSSWRTYLLEILNGKKFNWSEIKKKTFINGALIDEIIEEFRALVPFCPEDRKLIHGDFGSNNLLVGTAPAFTGVIDWDCAAYGDFRMTSPLQYFWRTWLMCMAETAAYWEKGLLLPPDYHKRIRCYALSIGRMKYSKMRGEGNAAFTGGSRTDAKRF